MPCEQCFLTGVVSVIIEQGRLAHALWCYIAIILTIFPHISRVSCGVKCRVKEGKERGCISKLY